MNYMYILVVMNVIAGIVLIATINHSRFPLRRLGVLGKGGVWIGSIGLVVQSLRTAYNDFVGEFPFNDFPIWMLKDFGYWLIALGFLIAVIKAKSE